MAFTKVYTRINWEDYPSVSTALCANNLNRMDHAINVLDNEAVELDARKAEQATVLNMVKDWSIDEDTGIITVTKLNGTKIMFDLNIEKIPVRFTLSSSGILTMTTDDGSEFTANIGLMIPVLSFEESDNIGVTVKHYEIPGAAPYKIYTFTVKDGSITEEKLQPNFLADIKVQAANAANSAKSAAESANELLNSAKVSESYAVGGTGTREGEDTDNAKYYKNEAKQYRDEAFKTTPNGYSDLVQNVADNTVKIDTVIEKAELNIRNTASGENIHLTDSSDSKAVEFALYGKATQETTTGKNLLKNTATSLTSNDITFTVNKDGTIVANGTANASAEITIAINVDLIGKEVILSGCPTGGSYNTYRIQLNSLHGDNSFASDTGNGIIVTPSTKIVSVAIYINSGQTVSNLVFKPMIRLADIEDDTYEPYTGGIPSPNPDYPQDIEVAGSSGSVVVKSCGKNIVNTSIVTYDSSTGVTVVENEDKTYTLNGTATKNGYISLSKNLYLKGKFVISGGNSNCNLYAWVSNNKYYWDSGNGVVFENHDESTYFTVNAYIVQGKTYTNEIIKPMIRACDENGNPIGDDTYEPYKETSSAIPTPNGLAGIPVESDGNYTDENGQQRVCDVIVKYANGSGEYIQKFEEIIFDGSQKFVGAGTNTSSSLAFNYFPVVAKIDGWTKVMSNAFSYISWEEYTSEGINGIGGNNNVITIKIDRNLLNNATGTNAENVELFEDFLISKYNEGNPVKALYQLRTPICTPLTAEQIAEIEKLGTFYPVTNISNDADCGMEITYMADAKNYIDNRLALIEMAMLSNI